MTNSVFFTCPHSNCLYCTLALIANIARPLPLKISSMQIVRAFSKCIAQPQLVTEGHIFVYPSSLTEGISEKYFPHLTCGAGENLGVR